LSTHSTIGSYPRDTTALSREILVAWKVHAQEQYLASRLVQAMTQGQEHASRYTLNSMPSYMQEEIEQWARSYIAQRNRVAAAEKLLELLESIALSHQGE
jgi:hypothetical protein